MSLKSIIKLRYILFPLVVALGVDLITPTNSMFSPHQFEKGRCWSEMNKFNTNMRLSSCQPRDTIVDLMAEQTTVGFIPDKVVVKRCGGFCFGKAACLPTKTRQVKYGVHKHNYLKRQTTCGSVILEEDLECGCGCSVMEHHCTSKQIYASNQCTCVCANTQERDDCIRSNKVWDLKTCSCHCKETNMECTTGSEWIPRMCQCMRVMMNNDVTLDYDEEEPQYL